MLIEGSMLVDIYDTELNFITNVELFSGDTIALLNGGHGITFLKTQNSLKLNKAPLIQKLIKKDSKMISVFEPTVTYRDILG